MSLIALWAASAQAANIGFTGEFTRDNDLIAIEFTITEALAGELLLIRNWGYGGTNPGGVSVDELNGVPGATTMEIGSGNFDATIQVFDSNGDLVQYGTNTDVDDDAFTSEVTSRGYDLPNPLDTATTYEGETTTYSVARDPQVWWVIGDELAAGVYTLVLSQHLNHWVSGDPYGEGSVHIADDDPDYTAAGSTENPTVGRRYECDSGYFCDVIAAGLGEGYNRTGAYALEFVNVEDATLVFSSVENDAGVVPLPGAAPLLAGALGGLALLRRRRASAEA